MDSDWHDLRLDEIGNIVTGTTPPSARAEYFGSEYPFLTPSDMDFDHIRTGTERHISDVGQAKLESRLVPPGSVAVVCIGATIGKVTMTTDITLTNQQINSIVVDQEQHDQRFIFYAMRNQREHLQKIAGGAATPIVNKTTFSSFTIPVPPLHTQKRISFVLGAYDELIQNNLRRIEVLEEMAQAVYREWFVNFRFWEHKHVKMVDSSLGMIPEGWRVSTLGEQSIVVLGQSPSSKHYNDDGEGLPFHQGVTDFGQHFPTHVRYCTVDKRLAEPGDALVSVRAPVGRINVADKRLVIGRGLAAIRALKHKGFHYRQLRHIFREEDSMGGGTIYKAITKKDLLSLPWLVPDPETRDAFDALERPMFELIANQTRQNFNLKTTRDLLLPKLVSGEIDVSTLDINTEWLAA